MPKRSGTHRTEVDAAGLLLEDQLEGASGQQPDAVDAAAEADRGQDAGDGACVAVAVAGADLGVLPAGRVGRSRG
jgi:hypothetical protein